MCDTAVLGVYSLVVSVGFGGPHGWARCGDCGFGNGSTDGWMGL